MHDVSKIENQKIGACYYLVRHPSNLPIYYFPMPGKAKAGAMIFTKFGSVNCNFKTDAMDDYMELPDGIAHFLEHKLFEGKDGNAFDFYAATGAKANAYTSNDRTAYYFTTTDGFYESLDILLRFVKHPYFTAENVEKEKGIIAQEIKMYDDEPSWQGYLSMVQGLYQNHPVRIDIAGTVESIGTITDTMLYDCYNAFYDNQNMVLCIAGDLSLDKILQVCDKHLGASRCEKVQQKEVEEPKAAAKTEVVSEMVVAKPIFYLGLKDPDNCFLGEDFCKKEMETELLLNIVFGQSSPLYKEMYQSGLINAEFSCDYENGRNFGFLVFAGESDDAAKVQSKILQEMKRVLCEGINEQQFLQARNALYGMAVRDMDDAYGVLSRFVNCSMHDIDVFSPLHELEKITLSDVMERAKVWFGDAAMTLSVVRKKEEV